ncbi:hypothetical protein D9613_003761 [Agrocybe pediades]|uniref:Alpha/beta hydrolase fold-3 domain-containing protein n=1 Tax=Agrocybe pediades TaxID=84607 RepID=A0A8H4QJ20_9AGAR|nr:hypothetical protein D9613_003761 [Agrocybe pediades]
MTSTTRPYGQITGLETLGLFGAVLTMPFVQALRLLKKPFNEHDRVRTWRRVKADAGFGYAVSVLNAYQIQFVDGSTTKVYEKWAPTVGVKPDIEKIDEGANLLWATPRKRKRVLVYLHGGGYVLPAPPFSIGFWKHVTDNLNKKDEDTSLVIVEYGLYPKVEFPVPLKQMIATVKHLFSAGYKPEDILLVGDSAGAGLIVQLFAHILHPVPGVPEFSIPSPLAGTVLISPFVAMDVTSPSFTSNAHSDIFSVDFFVHLRDLVKPTIPESLLHYVEPVKAPREWFKGIDKLVSRVYITSGDSEVLRDDIKQFSEEIHAFHKDATWVNIPNGTHNEPYGTLVAGEPEVGEWPTKVTDWIAAASR